MDKRNTLVDCLRGMSVLVVISMHYTMFFPNPFGFFGRSIGNGYYGVIAFFCISGFLITSRWVDSRQYAGISGVVRFYRARVGRIVPNLALLLVFLSAMSYTSIYGFALTEQTTLLKLLTSVLTLRYDTYFLYGGNSVVAWAPLWSLMIEEKFYLIFPLVVLLSRKTWILAGLMIILCVVAPINRANNSALSFDCLGCFDSIAFGVLTALATRHTRGRFGSAFHALSLAAGLFVLAYVYLATDANRSMALGPTGFAIGTAMVLLASPGISLGRAAFITRPLTILGILSYEIYLFHIAIYALFASVGRYLQSVDVAVLFIAIVSTITVVAFAINSGYSEPLNAFVRRHLLDAGGIRARLRAAS